ncbi:hypothetical protein [Ornithinibacillus sp. FSL M8-0202]|uniref:hypothetical protein n=1 Tax=Ornithinibacillus sp. FSL M8-0202 TaxID=2921616 RepID=UPI0030D2B24B
MTTLTLSDLETRVRENKTKFQATVNRVTAKIKSQNLNQGRIRPKDPTESKILDRFNRK